MPKLNHQSLPAAKPEPLPVPLLALRVNQAAQAANLSRSTLYNEMKAGNLHFVKCGSRRLIPVAELEAFLSHLAGVA